LLARNNPSALVTQNVHGRIPLHVAIENQKEWKLLECLVRLSPTSVQIPVGTRARQLPLHLMLRLHCSTKRYTVDEIMKVWNAYPDAALTADPTTGLFPFQMAAMASAAKSRTSSNHTGKKKGGKTTSSSPTKGNVDKASGDRGDDELYIIYSLLQGAPQVLKLFVRS